MIDNTKHPAPSMIEVKKNQQSFLCSEPRYGVKTYFTDLFREHWAGQYSQVQLNTAQYSQIQPSTVKYSPLSTFYYSPVQPS